MSLQCPNGTDCRLQFGMKAPTFIPLNNIQTIISRGISTVPLHPTPATYTDTTESKTTTNSETTDIVEVTSNEDGRISSVEEDALGDIMESQTFNSIYDLVS